MHRHRHRDIEVVEQFERFVEALGDRYLRDVRYLRAGEAWSEKLEAMIVEADIFQLFWSSNSMTSPFVRQEWEYALSLQRPNFIRPTYWEEPLPAKPEQKLPPEELMRLHFQRIHGADNARRPTAHPTKGAVPMAASPETTRSRPASGEGRYSDTIEFPPPPPASILEDSLEGIGNGGSSGNYSDEYAGPILAASPPPPSPMAAAPIPSYSPIGESSRSGAGGRTLDFVDAPASKSKSLFFPVLIVLALGLLSLIGVILYLLFS